MTIADKPIKLTVQIHDKALYKALRHLAVEQDRSVKELVTEALRDWVLKQEELEDLAAIRESEGEPTVSWEEVKAELRAAETKESAA